MSDLIRTMPTARRARKLTLVSSTPNRRGFLGSLLAGLVVLLGLAAPAQPAEPDHVAAAMHQIRAFAAPDRPIPADVGGVILETSVMALATAEKAYGPNAEPWRLCQRILTRCRAGLPPGQHIGHLLGIAEYVEGMRAQWAGGAA